MFLNRHLAAKWEKMFNIPGSKYPTELSSITLFVLLNLLGALNPKIPSYFPSTHIFYEKLADIESRMRSLHLLQSRPSHHFLVDRNQQFDIQGPTPGKGKYWMTILRFWTVVLKFCISSRKSSQLFGIRLRMMWSIWI